MKTRRGLAWLGVGVATLLWGGAASADIQTFWKTAVCPDFGGTKPPIAFEVGVMQAPIDSTITAGVGGAFCVLDASPLSAREGGGIKNLSVYNADIGVQTGDTGVTCLGMLGCAWDCVVCQYEDKVAAHPALSMWGTIALMGGVVTAMIFELRRRQAPGSV